MTASPLTLLAARRFLPLFVTQLLGALNDNLFKNALVVLALFRLSQGGPILVALASGVFILPYGLFSTLAGQLADKLEKSRLIRLLKLAEIALMGLAAAGFLCESFTLLMIVLFGLGVQAAFFSPLKYGILPDHLPERELVAGNGLIEAGTFLGILTGTIIGAALILGSYGAALTSVAGLAVAAAGTISAWFIPRSAAAAPALRIEWNLWRETVILIRLARDNRPVWLSIIGLSWFWTVGATVLAEFPVIAKTVLQADDHVVTLLLTLFALGVGSGSLACARLLRDQVSPRLVPFAILGISLFTADFALTCDQGGVAGLHSVSALLAAPIGWRIMGELFLLAFCGGLYSVPLYAILQEDSPPECRARMVGCNNVLNALFMVAGAGGAAALAAIHWTAPAILLLTAALNLMVALACVAMLARHFPDALPAWLRGRF